MIKVTITSPEIRELKGTSKTTNRPYHIRTQVGYLHTVAPSGEIAEIPDKFEIALSEDEPGYTRGHYQLLPSSLYVNRDGRLDCRARLAPWPATPAKT